MIILDVRHEAGRALQVANAIPPPANERRVGEQSRARIQRSSVAASSAIDFTFGGHGVSDRDAPTPYSDDAE